MCSIFRSPLASCGILILPAILIALSPIDVTAVPMTYTYEGNFFVTISDFDPPPGSYSTTDRVTGSFTTASVLAANLPLQDLTPTAFSFNDGRNTLSSDTLGINVIAFQIGTDAMASISKWDIEIQLPFPNDPRLIGDEELNIKTISGSFDFGQITYFHGTGTVGDFGTVSNSPGTWAQATPEPSVLLLLGSGLAGLCWYRRSN